MKAAFNGNCEQCKAFKPRCALIRFQGRRQTVCEECRRKIRNKYSLDARHKNLVVQKMQDNAALAKQIHELADTFVVGATQCRECAGLGVVLGDGEEVPCPKCGEPATKIRSRKDGWG